MNNKIMYDSFELLYVYIKKIDRCFEDTYFSFTNDYDIEYDYDNKRLKIVKKDASVLTNFLSNKIKSINLIVGKNGCGKTTLFDLLGLMLDDRYDVFNLDYKDERSGWFALYKCGSTNEFYVEGFNCKLLFLENYIGNEEIKQMYSIHFTYDFITNNIKEISFSGSYEHHDCPFVFYNQEIRNSSLFPQTNPKIIDRDDYSYLINRKYIKNGKLTHLYYLATNNYDFFKKIENESLAIVIRIKNESYYEDEGNFDLLFNSKVNNDEYLKLEIKDRYRYNLLKTEIYDIYHNVIKKNKEKHDKYLMELKNLEQFDTIINKINLICKITCKYLDTINGLGVSFGYYEFLDEICNKINQLTDKYINYSYLIEKSNIFSKINEVCEIKINLNDQFDQNVFNLLELYEMGNNGPSLLGDFKKVFKVHLNNNISEGELQLINTYSGIYYALTNGYKNQKSAIILLDEPDKSFHPMWISSFIDNLVKLVESIDNDMKYQFIISTHSPFMLSDIPKDCITCIDIVDHQRIVSKAKKSFASNYYDIIKDTFFLEDSVGMFAKRKINEMIEVINNIDNNINEENIKRINDMISVIDDDYLKNILHSELNKKISNFNQKMALELEQENLIKRINEISMKLGELND
ncbi:MAG: AAA family ATPase [[Clostridium] spiroforme]|uniref:AAA family ATPase n=1 Tax=Thomasclavelia spiroformis TaxID=29348 RepID=A0A943EIY6_9FIRM|nr:AAA family ATPase [Thomasclavelia spiroformis]MBS5587577.1 AAA family ATPase [Thomasclavelia spiroformis]